MTKMEEIVLVSEMIKSLKDMTDEGLEQPMTRLSAYDGLACMDLPGWLYSQLDAAAHCGEVYRRRFCTIIDRDRK